MQFMQNKRINYAEVMHKKKPKNRIHITTIMHIIYKLWGGNRENYTNYTSFTQSFSDERTWSAQGFIVAVLLPVP